MTHLAPARLVVPPAVVWGLVFASAASALAWAADPVAWWPVPVVLDVEPARWPRPIEEAAYFLVAEALTNVYRHAQASQAHVTVREAGCFVVVTVADDGVGGVRCHLRGLEQRAAAVGGHLLVDSPAGAGTTLRATLPLPSSVSR